MKSNNQEKPQILTFNLTEKANNALETGGFNIQKGSLGKLVRTKLIENQTKYYNLNYHIPQNTHEFDIIVIDLSNNAPISINGDRDDGKNKFIVKNEITDPRPYASHLLKNEIADIIKKESLIIVFQDKYIEKGGFSIYEFVPCNLSVKNKFGLKTEVTNSEYAAADILTKFLSKFEDKFSYENIFSDPEDFYRILVENSIGEIISFEYQDVNSSIFIFPILKDNSDFILEFLQNVAPTICPNLFPSAKKWIQEKDYFLPNHQKLLDDKKEITDEFELKIKEKDDEISSNYEEHSFLHNILTETGDNLVLAVIEYLKWLGFKKVVDMDAKKETEENKSEDKKIKEEDIQIENEKGLLVIEVKGIRGTSTDPDCSQISKVKYRRAEERGKFDVKGLYIVNHQRHLPAAQRKNPPFSKEQRQDAINEKRGLLTTWQLFNLYYDIQNNTITKEKARSSLYDYGLISFKPENISFIGEIEEVFKEPQAFILKLNNTEIKQGDIFFIEKDERFRKLEVLKIKLNEKSVPKADQGEVGIKGDFLPKVKSKVWIRKDDADPQQNS